MFLLLPYVGANSISASLALANMIRVTLIELRTAYL